MLHLQWVGILMQSAIHLCRSAGVHIWVQIGGLAEVISFALNHSWVPVSYTWAPKVYLMVSCAAAVWIILSLHWCCVIAGDCYIIRRGKAGEPSDEAQCTAQCWWKLVMRNAAVQKSAGKESSVVITEKSVESSLHLKVVHGVNAATLH